MFFKYALCSHTTAYKDSKMLLWLNALFRNNRSLIYVQLYIHVFIISKKPPMWTAYSFHVLTS